jgi:crotonobetainyl-CoA:carnitine CoA-transferase CaiB-like acyl-CoA transferase
MVNEPLKGVRVLDLTRVLAGPLATMMLADLGADVIKVERPGTGDDTRGWGPPFADDGQSAYFRSVNRNKRSVALDFGQAEDRAVLEGLAAEADVVVDNFLPGVLARAGLDPAALLARHPKLVWCTITGFGADSTRPGYDFVVQAEQGWMAISGNPGGAPMKHGVALADVIAGKDAAVAICAALFGRDRAIARGTTLPPRERQVVISLATSAAAALVNVAQNVLVGGADASRWGNAHANLVPYQLFDAADQPFVLAVGTDAQWPAAARVFGLASLAANAALATNAGRLAARHEVVSAIADVARRKPAAVWGQALDAVGVPNGVVRSVAQVLASINNASAVTGMPSPVGGTAHRPPPQLDEHGAAIRAIVRSEHRWPDASQT